ncbi:hypothetical protein [Flavobacterium beibuense]|uniref:hypothetical protein n=1 Tax=Flavobacterium beibuense TaxID=657326 RepID=UPI003A93CA91
MENVIFLRQVLELMKRTDENGNAIPFDIEFRTFNKNNKSGGRMHSFKGAKMLMGKKLKGKEFIEAEHFYRQGKKRKNPNHWDNKTRNIETPTGRIEKVKIRYITNFNGKQVCY